MCIVWLILIAFAGFQLGRIWFYIKPFLQDFMDSDEVEYEVTSEESDGWYHEECGADVDHDAVLCPKCGEYMDTYKDDNDVEHHGLPMWELGDD